MRIVYLADLHVEHMIHQRGGISNADLDHLARIRITDSDVLVLVGDTRVVCNSRGYDNEIAELIGFDPQAVVEI